MKNYKVSYAGVPGTSSKISAPSPKLAALKFFSQNPCRNSIFVEIGWLREKAFSCEEMIEDIDGVDLEDVPLKVGEKNPPRNIGLIEEFLNHAILGEFHSWK